MSCAWPVFQVNLRGAFDHTGDLNDQLVIEKATEGKRALKGKRNKNDPPGGCINSKERTQIGADGVRNK